MSKTHDEIISVIKRHKILTAKEIATKLQYPFNVMTARISELKSRGLIRGTGTVKDGSQILRLGKSVKKKIANSPRDLWTQRAETLKVKISKLKHQITILEKMSKLSKGLRE